MNLKKKTLSLLSAAIILGSALSPLSVSAAKANGKNYPGRYRIGNNVNNSLTLRKHAELNNGQNNSNVLGYILKSDDPRLDVIFIEGKVGYVENVRLSNGSRLSGYINLDYCKEDYSCEDTTEYVIPDGTNNADHWNEGWISAREVTDIGHAMTRECAHNYKIEDYSGVPFHRVAKDKTFSVYYKSYVYGYGIATNVGPKSKQYAALNLNFLLPVKNCKTGTIFRHDSIWVER